MVFTCHLGVHQVGPAFSMPRVKKTIPAINQAADRMVAHLKETLARGEQVH